LGFLPDRQLVVLQGELLTAEEVVEGGFAFRPGPLEHVERVGRVGHDEQVDDSGVFQPGEDLALPFRFVADLVHDRGAEEHDLVAQLVGVFDAERDGDGTADLEFPVLHLVALKLRLPLRGVGLRRVGGLVAHVVSSFSSW
jgi:hypothetical protein